MNAVARVARDVSPVMERLVTIEMGNRSIDATVKYTVTYQSLWHRGHGIEPDVDVLSVTHEVGTEIRAVPLRADLLDFICTQIEADELELN